MKYSKQTAKLTASRIRERLGLKILAATTFTVVPPDFLAGLIAVESGGKENASRFEPHVFEKLKRVRNGELLQYNGIRPAQLEGATNPAIKNLATSWGATQTMGWWSIHLGITVGELRSPDTHLRHAVSLLLKNAGKYVTERDWASVLRIWNTGRPDGKTHDADYVYNATAVMEAYGCE